MRYKTLQIALEDTATNSTLHKYRQLYTLGRYSYHVDLLRPRKLLYV